MNLHTHQSLLRMVKLLLVVSVAFAGLFMATAKPAEAVTWWHTAELCNDWGDTGVPDCQMFTLYTATINTNQTTYAPGETISLSASTHNPHCSNYAISYSMSTTLGGVAEPLGSGSYNGGQTRYHNNTRTAPTTPGAYTITATYCALWPGTWSCTTRDIPITVVAPPAPSGTVSGSSCEIGANQSSCSGLVTWTINNAISPILSNHNDGTVYSNNAVGNLVPITLTYGDNKIAVRDGDTLFEYTIINVDCIGEFNWNGASCVSPSATISATGCDIEVAGESSCAGTATWSINNAANPSIYSNNGTTYSINDSGTDQSINLPYGVSTLYARDGGASLANTVVSVSCGSGLDWNGSQCDFPPPPPIPPAVIEINVDRELIRSGDTVEVETQISTTYPVSCTLSGVENSPVTFTVAPGVFTQNFTTRPLTSAQVVSISCEAAPAIAGVGVVTGEARINVVPVIQEI